MSDEPSARDAEIRELRRQLHVERQRRSAAEEALTEAQRLLEHSEVRQRSLRDDNRHQADNTRLAVAERDRLRQALQAVADAAGETDLDGAEWRLVVIPARCLSILAE